MSTAPPPTRSSTPTTARPGAAAPPGAGGGFVPIDPVKLVRQHWTTLVGAVFAGILIGAGLHFAILYTYPTFTSIVTYECVDPVTDPKEFGRQPVARDDYDRFMATQVAVMKSELILREAVQKPEILKTEWVKPFLSSSNKIQVEKAAERLGEQISARGLTGTSLMQLSMSWRKPLDAAIIVNAVDEAYQQDLKEKNRSQSADRRQALGRRLKELGDKVDLLNSLRDRLLGDNHVDAIEGAAQSESLKVVKLQQDLVELTSGIARSKSQLEGYQKQLEATGAQVFSDGVREEAEHDPIVQKFNSDIASLKAEVGSMLAQGFGDEHPDVILLRARIASQTKELDDAKQAVMRKIFDAIVDNLKTQVTGLNAAEQDLKAKLAEASKRREDLVKMKVQYDTYTADIDRQTKELFETEGAIKTIETLSGIEVTNRVRRINSGQIPKFVSFPRLEILVPLGAVLVTGLVGGLIALRELLDQRVRGPADIAVIPRVKVLGIIPQASEDPSRPVAVETAFRDSPASVITESFRRIRAPLVSRMAQAGHKSLLVLGGMPGSGATTVASNLAIGCAGAEERVLIIDANFRRPAMHKVFKLPEGPGLGDILAGTASLADAVRETSCPNLHVLTAGTSAGRAVPERLAGETMAKVLAEAKSKYDRIIVDAPPAIVTSDGMTLANRCDAVTLVVRAMAEKRGLVARLREQLSDVRAEMLGVIVNAVRSSSGGYFKRNIEATHQYHKSPA